VVGALVSGTREEIGPSHHRGFPQYRLDRMSISTPLIVSPTWHRRARPADWISNICALPHRLNSTRQDHLRVRKRTRKMVRCGQDGVDHGRGHGINRRGCFCDKRSEDRPRVTKERVKTALPSREFRGYVIELAPECIAAIHAPAALDAPPQRGPGSRGTRIPKLGTIETQRAPFRPAANGCNKPTNGCDLPRCFHA
jgi:hypothetical protein